MTTTTTVPSLDEIRERTQQLLADHPPQSISRPEFRGHQFDAGLAWVHFPVGKGGLGVSPKAQLAIDEVLRTEGHLAGSDLWLNPIGIGMAGPTLVQYASDEILDRCLRPMFTCEEVWCQLFSEPGAGSDVASLATRAVQDGDEWIINGQKVWTTLAHIAKWGLLVARSDPEAPKHRGMTYFVLDMEAPGVDVRPLRQITGEAEFNEVFMTDARVPDSWRLGDVGKGWEVSLTTLMNERVALGGSKGGRGSGPISDVIRLWGEHRAAPGYDAEADAALRDRVMRTWCHAETLRLTNLRAGATRRAGQPGPEGSVAKLLSAELNKEIYETALAIIGPEALLYPDYTMKRPDDTTIYGGDVRKSFLRSRANTIEGGTSEVMRNILGERVLGLPGEPRTDRDVPWSQVPRSGQRAVTTTVEVLERAEAPRDRSAVSTAMWKLEARIGRLYLRPPRSGLPRRLNLGCGLVFADGWTNADFATLRWFLVDRKRRPEWNMDATQPWRCADDHFEAIHCEHVLEHVPYGLAVSVLREALRTLEPGGHLRVVVPDLGKFVAFYDGAPVAEEFRRFALGPVAMSKLTQCDRHQSVWDAALLCSVLGDVGFVDAAVMAPGESRMPFPAIDNPERTWESVYVEAVKPTGGPSR